VENPTQLLSKEERLIETTFLFPLGMEGDRENAVHLTQKGICLTVLHKKVSEKLRQGYDSGVLKGVQGFPKRRSIHCHCSSILKGEGKATAVVTHEGPRERQCSPATKAYGLPKINNLCLTLLAKRKREKLGNIRSANHTVLGKEKMEHPFHSESSQKDGFFQELPASIQGLLYLPPWKRGPCPSGKILPKSLRESGKKAQCKGEQKESAPPRLSLPGGQAFPRLYGKGGPKSCPCL
jgi:hypothetical protein